MRTIGLVLVLVVAVAAPAAARDLFVNNVLGDDHNDGTEEQPRGTSGPFGTLQRALGLARPGDHIVLANTGQPYRESVSLSAAAHSGSGLAPFVISGRGATLDGSAPVPPDAWEFHRQEVFRFRPARSAYQQLFLDGKPAGRPQRAGVEPGDESPPPLEPLEWCLHKGWIYFRVERQKLPEDYPLSYASQQVGITLYHVHDVAILDLVVQGFQLDGINAHDGVRNCYLAGLTSRGNGRSGVAVAGSSSVKLEACLVGNNGAAQLYTEGQSVTFVRSSNLLPATAPPIVRAGGRVFVNGRPFEGED